MKPVPDLSRLSREQLEAFLAEAIPLLKRWEKIYFDVKPQTQATLFSMNETLWNSGVLLKRIENAVTPAQLR